MYPILFESTEKDFTTNGLGRLKDAISCSVTEERNGTYELSMVYPISGIHYDLLENDRIIYAMPADGKNSQPFRIYKISRPLSGKVTVSAEHISYLLASAVVMPFTASSCADAISKLNSSVIGASGFSFWTDKAVTGTYTLDKPTEVRTVLGGSSGSLLDTYGKGEYEFDGFDVKLYLNRGVDNGVTIRYGKNLTDITADTDITNVYTGIVPYATTQDSDGNEITVTLSEKVVKSSHTGDFAYPLYKVVDFSQNSDSEETMTEDGLRTLATDYVNNNNGWEVDNNLTVSFVALWQTDEYKNVAALERVNLCDTVHVVYTDLGVNTTAKVVKTDFDVLNERYNSIELGENTSNLSKTLNDAINSSTEAIADEVSGLPAAITKATKKLAGGLGGYVVLSQNANGEPEEILIMDTNDKNTAQNVIRMNKNGIGFSTTGYQGPFANAWTIDGKLVADYITTGTLNADLIKAGILQDEFGSFYLNFKTGELKIKNIILASEKDVRSVEMKDGQYFICHIDDGVQHEVGRLGATFHSSEKTEGLTLSVNENQEWLSFGLINDAGTAIYTKLQYDIKNGYWMCYSPFRNNFEFASCYKGTKIGGLSAVSFSGKRSVSINMYANATRFDIDVWSAETGGTATSHCSYFPADGYWNFRAKNIQNVQNLYVNNQIECKGNEYVTGNLSVSGNIGAPNISAGTYLAVGSNQMESGWNDEYNTYTLNIGGSIWAYVVWYTYLKDKSDRRLKDNIKDLDIDKSAKFVYGLKPTSYVMRDHPNEVRHGFIAQDVQEIVDGDWSPVGTCPDKDENGDPYLSLGYIELIADMVATIQSQHKRITDLEERLAKIEEALNADN